MASLPEIQGRGNGLATTLGVLAVLVTRDLVIAMAIAVLLVVITRNPGAFHQYQPAIGARFDLVAGKITAAGEFFSYTGLYPGTPFPAHS